jgi:hypothetical protein
MRNTQWTGLFLEFLKEPSDVHITRCHLDPQFLFEGNVTLKDIDIGEDLVGFLANCVAEKLVINRCPGFNDLVLHAMMTPESGPDLPGFPYGAPVPYVKDLSILNCRGFSISALKQLVEARRTQVIWSTPPPHFRALRLSGRVPDVSLEDREWFRGHVSEFSYNPTQY